MKHHLSTAAAITVSRATGLGAFLLAATSAWSQAADPTPADSWPVIGRQGIVLMVIVPADQATDRAAYDREIPKLCNPEHTCFLNFYTNSKGVPAMVPVPDAIANEATATFRRSMKNGVEQFKWSCRMKQSVDECF